MADEHQTSALVTYFVTKLKLYIKANGHNELATEALEFYKNGMVEFHDEQNFQTKLTILKRQAIHDQLLEYIYRMGENTNLKENTMKKSELKALIREVIEEEIQFHPSISLEAREAAEALQDCYEYTKAGPNFDIQKAAKIVDDAIYKSKHRGDGLK